MDQERFSERHGFAPPPADIAIRHEAPHELRGVLVDLAYNSGMAPARLRSVVCGVLLTRPDDNNWSPFPNIDLEVRELLDACEWFEVYDVIEAIYAEFRGETRDIFSPGPPEEEVTRDRFTAAINAYFAKRGVGWQLVDGCVEVRGPEAFELTVRPAVEQLKAAGLATAATQIHEALKDLARRPDPDVTGAIQHSLASLECVARTAAGDPKATLGEILSNHPGLIPRPLDDGVKKIWGYGSETARHLREGRAPSYEEAELVVLSSAAVATYLERKMRGRAGASIEL
jgi:hypothetical protein